MEYIFLFMAAMGVTFNSFMSKQFNTKAKIINPFFYTANAAFFAMVFFFVMSAGGKLHFTYKFLPYSIAFGITYGITNFSTVKAMKYGPMSLTALASSLSLVIPTLYGVVALNDPFGILKCIGVILLVFALILINSKKNNELKISPKWLMFATMSFLGNGFLAIIQKNQQMTFDGGYKNEFMIIALAMISVLFLILGLRVQGDKKKMIGECIKYAAPAGLANGMVNFLVMVLTTMVPTVILFSSIQALAMSLTFVLALVVFKEKLLKAQTIGYILGIISVVLLNM